MNNPEKDVIHNIPTNVSNIMFVYLRAQNTHQLECLRKVYASQRELKSEEKLIMDAIDMVLKNVKTNLFNRRYIWD